MAKYTVNFSCGHEAEVELFGKGTDREAKIKWYEEKGMCPECYRKMKEAEAKAVAEKNQVEKLTNGSEKQIAWAEKIRVNFLNNNSEIIEKMKTLKDEDKAKLADLVEKTYSDIAALKYGYSAKKMVLIEKIKKETSAVEIINNREKFGA